MKRIALLHDLSGFGKCSLTAAIPVISVMGIQACPLPTAILSAQTGFENYYCDDFTDKMDYFTEHWKQMDVTFDGIYSGYLAGLQQMEKVKHFLQQFQGENTLYLADPVLGDGGRQFDIFSKEFLQGMKELTELADVITPNLTELCLLSGEDYAAVTAYSHEEDYIKRLQSICQRLLAQSKKPQTVIVTGILRHKPEEMSTGHAEYIGNLAVSATESYYVESPYTGIGFSGTGDLFASVICGSLVKGLSVSAALEKAVDFLQGPIEEATVEKVPRNHGVYFEKYLSRLL